MLPSKLMHLEINRVIIKHKWFLPPRGQIKNKFNFENRNRNLYSAAVKGNTHGVTRSAVPNILKIDVTYFGGN